MTYERFNIKLTLTFVLLFCSMLAFAAPNPNNGESLFKANCASCHNKNMKAKMTGPALGGVQERWEGNEELLYTWIRNTQEAIATGDAYAVGIYNEWGQALMTAFPELTNENIDDILLYIDNVYEEGCAEPPCITPGGEELTGTPGEPEGFNWMYALLFGILALLALVLVRITSNLNHMAEVKAGRATQRKTLLETLTSRNIVTLAIFAAVVIGGFTTVNSAINLGRQQEYAPTQPIKFSHATHAGINKIDCQYCHDGARRSKHAVIPAVNTCMNCHKAINNGPTYGKAEIAKIYAASGFNPATGNYYEDNTPQDTLMKHMEAWLAADYKDKDGNDVAVRADIATEQFDEIKEYVGKDMEWVRIHNLPDHAYFNHSQHVVAGGVECQTCHGAVEEMEVVKQYAPLSMGWCVNCHRETEVQFADNPYYDSFEKYHNDLKSGKMDKVTVEDIGGLECQKCHY